MDTARNRFCLAVLGFAVVGTGFVLYHRARSAGGDGKAFELEAKMSGIGSVEGCVVESHPDEPCCMSAGRDLWIVRCPKPPRGRDIRLVSAKDQMYDFVSEGATALLGAKSVEGVYYGEWFASRRYYTLYGLKSGAGYLLRLESYPVNR